MDEQAKIRVAVNGRAVTGRGATVAVTISASVAATERALGIGAIASALGRG